MLVVRAARPIGCRGLAPRVPLHHRLATPFLQASRWLSTTGQPGAGVAGATDQPAMDTKFRTAMLGALKGRRYDEVLSTYDTMVESGAAPDLLALNCIIEAKAHNEGTAKARETLQVKAPRRPMPACSIRGPVGWETWLHTSVDAFSHAPLLVHPLCRGRCSSQHTHRCSQTRIHMQR
jgi:hypothetical protein